MHRTALLRRAILVAAISVLAIAVATVVGCGNKAEEAELTPKVTPPVIGEAGVLRAGVDLEYAPFGAVVDGENVGIDIDVASALAERLGLKLEVVSVPATQAPTALADGRIDVALGGLTLNEDLLTQVTFAGTYLTDGPGFFSSEDATLTLTGLGKRRPAVQAESAAYWAIERDLGSEIASSYPTLREAFEALEAGHTDSAAGDAIVGAYIARDFSKVRFAGQIGSAVPIGIAVKKDATELETSVRDALDALAADGVLDAIRAKWVGDLPPLTVEVTQDT